MADYTREFPTPAKPAPKKDPEPPNTYKGFLDLVSEAFETGAGKLMDDLKAAEAALQADPSNPSVLAKYQAKLQEYTLFRNAQTNTVKAYKDISAAIIQNFR